MAWRETLQRAWWAPRPAMLAWLLWPVSLVYRALAALSRALARPQHVGVPVIVVGNLVVGGAGKTPTVIALVQALRAAGWTPGVVSRGHGRRGNGLVDVTMSSAAAEVGDEPLLIHRRTAAPLVVGRDRVAAARALRQAHPQVDVIVSDDGLQHHRLARDVQVIVFDARGAGNAMLLPAGPLREPLPAAAPARSVVLYTAPQPSTPLPGFHGRRRLAGVLPLDAWQRGGVASDEGWQALRERPVTAAAGIAQPERFFALLHEQGLALRTVALPDHHAFDTLPWDADTADVVVTEKDAVKLAGRNLGATRLWVAPLDFEPEPGFAAAVLRHLPARATR